MEPTNDWPRARRIKGCTCPDPYAEHSTSASALLTAAQLRIMAAEEPCPVESAALFQIARTR